MPKLCAWLGIRDDAAAVAAMTHPERSPFAHYGPDNAPMGNDRLFLESPELRAPQVDYDLAAPLSWDAHLVLGGEIRSLAARFGYPG